MNTPPNAHRDTDTSNTRNTIAQALVFTAHLSAFDSASHVLCPSHITPPVVAQEEGVVDSSGRVAGATRGVATVSTVEPCGALDASCRPDCGVWNKTGE